MEHFDTFSEPSGTEVKRLLRFIENPSCPVLGRLDAQTTWTTFGEQAKAIPRHASLQQSLKKGSHEV